jgi:VWFA-related protein
VEIVRVDVIVKDNDGAFIDDLRADEFTLFEDGARQDIVSVELVDLAARQVQRVTTEGIPSGPTPELRPAVPAGDLGAVIFFIDLPGLAFKSSIDFAESMKRVFAKVEKLSLPYAIYLVDMAGRLREIQPLTVDVAALQGAAGTVRSTPASVSRENLFGALDADSGSANRFARFTERTRTLYTFELLRDFVDSLAHRSGRTALVWVSTGVDLAAYDTIARPYRITGQQDPMPGVRSRSYSPDLNVLGLQTELHQAANSVNVSIYSVDPSTLADFHLAGIGLKRRGGGAEDARGNSLRNAAHATGGDVFIGWTDLDRVLVNIERDAGRFYLLSYVPPIGGEGEYHEIRVEVGRRGADVRARGGYVRYSEGDRLSRTVRSALDLPGTVSGFDVAVDGVRARAADGQAILILDTAVGTGAEAASSDGVLPAGAAGEAPLVDGRSLLLFATVRDRNGEIVAMIENQRLTPQGSSASMPRIGAGAPFYWTHRVAHRLEPGEYDVSVAVIDRRSERIGASKLSVQIPDAAGEWDTSDPQLVVETADGSTTPVIGGQILAGLRVFMYVEVYNGVSPEVGGRVLPFAGDDPLQLAAESRDRDEADPGEARHGPSIALTAEGELHHGSVPLTALPAGHYLLDFYIDDTGAGRSRTVRLPLHVVPPR